MRCFQIDRRSHSALERLLPARYTETPAVARFQPGKTPFRMGRDEIVAHQDRVIQKVARHLRANRVQTDIFRSGAAIAVAVKTRGRLAAARAQVCSEDVRGHGGR